MDGRSSRGAPLRPSLSASSASSSGAPTANTSTRETSPDPRLRIRTVAGVQQSPDDKMDENSPSGGGDGRGGDGMAGGTGLEGSARGGQLPLRGSAHPHGPGVTGPSGGAAFTSDPAAAQVQMAVTRPSFRQYGGPSACSNWRTVQSLAPTSTPGHHRPSFLTSTPTSIRSSYSGPFLAPTSIANAYPSPPPDTTIASNIDSALAPNLTPLSTLPHPSHCIPHRSGFAPVARPRYTMASGPNSYSGTPTKASSYMANQHFLGDDELLGLEDAYASLMPVTTQPQHLITPPAHSTADVARAFRAASYDSAQYYCLDRGNGLYTRLIPADMLPDLVDVPKTQYGHEGMVVLPDLKGVPAEGKSSNNSPVQLKVSPRGPIGGSPNPRTTAEANMMKERRRHPSRSHPGEPPNVPLKSP